MSYLSPQEQVLQHAAPDIYAKVRYLEDHFPQLNGRALRAGFLAAGGAVNRPPGGQAHLYYVTSSNGRRGSFGTPSYIVELDGKGKLQLGTCTCPDYFNGLKRLKRGAPIIHGAPKCKHILAVAIVLAIKKDQEKASVEGVASTEAAQLALRRTPGPSDDSTPHQDEQTKGDAKGNPPTYQGQARQHDYSKRFRCHTQAHPEYRKRRWRR